MCFTPDLAEDLISRYLRQPFCSLCVSKRNDCGDTIGKDCL